MKAGKMHGHLDNILVQELDFIKALPNKNFDCFAICTGSEGSGKTTLFMSICGYLDPDFCLDKIVFTPDQFEEAIDIAKPGSAILFDEADIMSDHVMNQRLRILSKVMKRIRSKRLFLFFVTPTFFDMSKYFAIHRSRFLVQVYTVGLKRGAFRFFNSDAKRLLYIKGKKFWDMKAHRPSFFGTFGGLPDSFPVDMVAYNRKKDDATKGLFDDGGNVKDMKVSLRQGGVDRLDTLYFQKHGKYLTQKDLAFVFDVDQSTISKDRRDIGRGVDL